MTLRLTGDDLNLLAAIAEHRVLTKGQMVRLFSRNERALRGRLNELAKVGYLDTQPTLSSKRGRPEIQATLTPAGIGLLETHHRLPEDIAASLVLAGQLVWAPHHRALNDFRVCLAVLPAICPSLKIDFITATSPVLRMTEAGRAFAADWLDGQLASQDSPGLIPDAVFMIRHEPRDKSLLFFLEVDMGTESLASPTRARGDLRHKIQDYQSYSRSERYRRYGDAWKCQFNGFRVLFVTAPPGRRASVCRLVVQHPPSDFIWVADQDQLVTQGLAAPVWSRGGRTDIPEASILGPDFGRQLPAGDPGQDAASTR